MGKLKIKAEAPDALNRPALWYKPLKPYFDVQAYQERIDARVPRSKDDQSVIRLVWAADINEEAFGEVLPRYWTRRQRVAADQSDQNATGSWKYWRIPRWILERRIEIEQYAPAWEASRYAMQDNCGRPLDAGEPPHEYYVFAHLIADHEALDASGWPACCNRAFITDRSRCWGKYRQPGELELTLISQAMRQMEAAKHRDPYRPLTSAELAEIKLMAGMQVEREAEADLQRGREAAADFYGISTSALPDDWGRRNSGLIVPK